ncbi:hypothetical protein [Thioalkalivibrio sp. ALJ16]|uniref:hypothetical protein n=1 Tax=Thioalkalivibrio sp. ALJ16 TaxID=1158762 RepID=UPI00035F680C|nr:hypothetical protein [Thioalkalivibrio sp. ALJ16]
MKRLLLHKSDGLGARLREILVGLTLSRLLGWPLAIKWDTSGRWIDHRGWHDHLDQDRIFDAAWLEQFVEQGDGKRPVSTHTHWPFNRLDWVMMELRSRDVLLKKVPKDPGRLIAFTSEPEVRRLLQKAFESIGFSETARQALEAGRARAPEHGIAVHVRQGDVVKGEYRFHGNWTDKAIPAPVARFIGKKLADDGGSPVMVSADECFLEWEDVTVEKAAIRAEKPNDPVGAMFYDIGLMSGCEIIVMGADCNFGLIAAWSRNRTISTVSGLVSSTDLQQIADGLLDGSGDAPDALDRAYTAQWLLIQQRNALREGQREALLGLAKEGDPGNPVYYMINAAQALMGGDEHEAEIQAREAVGARDRLDDHVDWRFATDLGFGAKRLLDMEEAVVLAEYQAAPGSSLAEVLEWVRGCSGWQKHLSPSHKKVYTRTRAGLRRVLLKS